jgi:hypothetical protein
MGNRKSDTEEEKSSTDFKIIQTYSIYKLIDQNGGGELVDFMRIALKSNDFTRVDEFIKKNVSPFLLNNGEGQMVSFLEFYFKINSFKKI